MESMLMILTCLIFILWKITSKEQNRIKYHMKFLFYYFYIFLLSVLLMPVFLLKPGSARNGRICAWFAGPIACLCDFDFVLRGGQILSADRGAVVVANHQSSLDVLGILRQWRVAKNLTVVAKKELSYIWPFALACKLLGIIFIDRSQPKAAYESMIATSHVMQNKKNKIWVFPEGKRNANINQFLPFRKGAFAMAVAAQVPIIPIVYSPYYFVNKSKHIFSRGHVIMQCLEPVPTKGLSEKDIPALIEIVRDKMFSTFQELRKEVLNSLPVNYPHPIDC